MKIIGEDEFYKAFNETDGYLQYDFCEVKTKGSFTEYRMVYEDPDNKFWIVNFDSDFC